MTDIVRLLSRWPLPWAAVVLFVWATRFLAFAEGGSKVAQVGIWLAAAALALLGILLSRRFVWGRTASSLLAASALLVAAVSSLAGVPVIAALWSAMAATSVIVCALISESKGSGEQPIGRSESAILAAILGLLFVQFCGGYWLPDIFGTPIHTDGSAAVVSLAGVAWLLVSKRADDGFPVAVAVWVTICMHATWAAEQQASWTLVDGLDPSERGSLELGRMLFRAAFTMALVDAAALVRLSGMKDAKRIAVAVLPHVLLVLAFALLWARASGRLPLAGVPVPIRAFH
jgi:hypothetical protein